MIEPVVVRTLEGAEFHQDPTVLSLVKIPVKSAQWAQMGGSYIYKVLNFTGTLARSNLRTVVAAAVEDRLAFRTTHQVLHHPLTPTLAVSRALAPG